MRIAAGVLIIITAIFNLIGGLGYGAVGAGGAAVNSAAESGTISATNPDGSKKTAEQIKAEEETLKAAASATENAGLLGIFGIFLMIVGGLQIAGGVMLFMQKAANFVLIIAALGIIGELGGIFLTTFGIMNIVGLVACALALVASRSYAGGAAAA
ncbi:MAG: hypothetical protein ACE366_01710 [Bradymonadia bacterium]